MRLNVYRQRVSSLALLPVLAQLYRIDAIYQSPPLHIGLVDLYDSALLARMFLAHLSEASSFLQHAIGDPYQRRTLYQYLFQQYVATKTTITTTTTTTTTSTLATPPLKMSFAEFQQTSPKISGDDTTTACTLLSNYLSQVSSTWPIHYVGVGITLVLEEWIHSGADATRSLERFVQILLGCLARYPRLKHMYCRLLDLPLKELDTTFLQSVRTLLSLPEPLYGGMRLATCLANNWYAAMQQYDNDTLTSVVLRDCDIDTHIHTCTLVAIARESTIWHLQAAFHNGTH
jgi:hypothetical protein